MKITEALLGEHGAMYPLLAFIERTAPAAGLDELRTLAAFLNSTLASHAALEDTLLKPAILPWLPRSDGGPTDHQLIDAGLARVRSAPCADEARATLLATVAKTRKHFDKEERIIFVIAGRELTEEAQHELGARWALSRGVSIAAPVRPLPMPPAYEAAPLVPRFTS